MPWPAARVETHLWCAGYREGKDGLKGFIGKLLRTNNPDYGLSYWQSKEVDPSIRFTL